MTLSHIHMKQIVFDNFSVFIFFFSFLFILFILFILLMRLRKLAFFFRDNAQFSWKKNPATWKCYILRVNSGFQVSPPRCLMHFFSAQGHFWYVWKQAIINAVAILMAPVCKLQFSIRIGVLNFRIISINRIFHSCWSKILCLLRWPAGIYQAVSSLFKACFFNIRRREAIS